MRNDNDEEWAIILVTDQGLPKSIEVGPYRFKIGKNYRAIMMDQHQATLAILSDLRERYEKAFELAEWAWSHRTFDQMVDGDVDMTTTRIRWEGQ